MGKGKNLQIYEIHNALKAVLNCFGSKRTKNIYSASMKSYQYKKFDIFGKYMIQLDSYICIHVSGQLQTGLKKNTNFSSPGTMVRVMHVLFVFRSF